jgi:hypothetical protein
MEHFLLSICFSFKGCKILSIKEEKLKMKKGISVLITFLIMTIFNISQYPIYAASTASATFTEKPSDIGKAGLRIEREVIPGAGQKTNDINSSPGFMESYSPYEYGVTMIDPLAGQDRSKAYGINNSGQVVGKSYNYTAEADDFIIDHRCTDISQIPEEWVNNAKADLHIAYGHTSHGSQLITGMNGLDAFMGGTGLYDWNDGPLAGALDIDDYFVDGDLGNPDRTTWEQRTRDYLEDPANSDVNVIIWSWCGQADTTVENIELYLSLMTGLETDYPDVKFIYMTGHLNGGGLTGNLHLRNEQIRTYCRDNNKILYDFADIETYDPDGTYFGDKIPDDTCAYDTDNNGTRDGNWAIEWQDLHVEGVDWYDCDPAHTQPLNGNLKAYAAWWLFARITGWAGVTLGDELALDFGASGLWDYDGTNWAFISGSSPEDMAGWSGGLALDFGASGLWNFDGTIWTPISGSNIEDITDWANGLAVDFGASGVWNYDGSTWTLISGSNPEGMVGWTGGLAMDFGASGLWSYDGSAWSPISGSSPEGMAGWSGGLAMDFGASGLWSYDGTIWNFITGLNVEDIADWANGLAIDFGASGVWNYDGSNWTPISGSSPEGMVGWSIGLAMDFGASGLWSYDGTIWAFISSSDVEDIDDVDLY